MIFHSINPYTLDTIAEYEGRSDTDVEQALDASAKAFREWRLVPVERRAEMLRELHHQLMLQKDEMSEVITQEMGKPIREAQAEIDKCAGLCLYYAEKAITYLAVEAVATDALRSYVRYDPLGTVFAIMPWNFPFWQVFRCAVPAITSGNTVILKHAPNVLGCAARIEQLFADANYPPGVFQQLAVHHNKAADIIAHQAVQGVAFTGSNAAGAVVASIAGAHVKKSVLELGGSNAFVVWPDANVEDAVALAVQSRFANAGQSCIASKRIIVTKAVYEQFLSCLMDSVNSLVPGDPLNPHTTIGPMARVDLAEKLEHQVAASVSMGAVVLQGGRRSGAYFEPTILENVKPGMPAFDEETFGPVACLTLADTVEDAMELAARTTFGLPISTQQSAGLHVCAMEHSS